MNNPLILLAQATTQTVTQAAAPVDDSSAASTAWKTLLQEGSRLLTEYGFRVIGALVFLIGAWMVSAWLVRIMVRALMRTHIDITLAKFLSNLVRWGLLVLVIVACLGIFGVPATSFITVLGTVGLAVGLALQGSLSHLAAGIMLMVFRPFRVGDAVVVAGQAGIVDEIELFSTRLDTPDNRRIIIPNGQIFGAVIINNTHHDLRRTDIPVAVAYGSDINKTRHLILQSVGALTTLAEGRPVDVQIAALSPASVDWVVGIWTSAANAGVAKQDALQRIKESLENAGIEGPRPQIVLTPAAARA